ncbi:MAG TPA: FkbM family methyltransferase [Pirellulales bacterium]|nr:FkbM family methyltransferase [Pirellulales bacterium]
MLAPLKTAAKFLCKNTLWADGAVRTVLLGPSAGLRYRIFPNYGLAPIFGGWEPRLQTIMKRLLKLGDVAYDVGANYGIHTLLMARLVGAGGHVYGFEPHPEIHAACLENVRLNAFNNVDILKLALSDHEGDIPFSTGHHDGAGHVAAAEEEASMTVRCDTIDSLIAAGRLRPPQFLKVDIEGYAGAALAGAAGAFARHRPALCVDLHDPEEDEAVGGFLADWGYAAFRQETFEPIKRLDVGWPNPDGIRGTVLALPAERADQLCWLHADKG